MHVGDPVDDMPVAEVGDKYVVLDGDNIEPDFTGPDFEAAQQASDEQGDVPSVQTGDRFSAIVTHIDSDAQEVWLTTKPVEHTAILTEPTSYMHDLHKGDEIMAVQVIGVWGSYLVCRGPSEMKVEEVPASPVSTKRLTDHDQSSSSSKPRTPSLGILRDNRWRKTRYKATPKVSVTKVICATSSVLKVARHQAGGFMNLTRVGMSVSHLV